MWSVDGAAASAWSWTLKGAWSLGSQEELPGKAKF